MCPKTLGPGDASWGKFAVSPILNEGKDPQQTHTRIEQVILNVPGTRFYTAAFARHQGVCASRLLGGMCGYLRRGMCRGMCGSCRGLLCGISNQRLAHKDTDGTCKKLGAHTCTYPVRIQSRMLHIMAPSACTYPAASAHTNRAGETRNHGNHAPHIRAHRHWDCST